MMKLYTSDKDHELQAFLQDFSEDIFGNTPGHLLGGLSYRIACEMRVARGGLDPRVAQELPYHGESFAERQGARGERMAQVMKPQAEAVFASLWPRRSAPSTSLRPLYRPRC